MTNVRWTYDDRMLLSTGGLDTAVLIWDRLVVSEVDEPGESSSRPLCIVSQGIRHHSSVHRFSLFVFQHSLRFGGGRFLLIF